MATSDAVSYAAAYTQAAATAAKSSNAVSYTIARTISGAYSPSVKSTSSRQESWRPRPNSPIGRVMPDGRVMIDPSWARWLDTLADRLGGPGGARVPDVVATVEAAQVSTAETAQKTQAIAQQAAANAATLAAAREVLQNAAIPGADQIPPPVFDGGGAIP